MSFTAFRINTTKVTETDMAGYRQGRINEQLTKELAEILRTVKDPRVNNALVSITGAECAADLKTAKITQLD